jgi:DNA-binding transcriptional ArsR family regulator
MESVTVDATDGMASVGVVRDSARAAVLLGGPRTELLEALRQPDSATGVARRLGLPRQQVNYHLRELERAGFVEMVEERRKGNCIERVLRASARSYVISPEVLSTLSGDPSEIKDRFSSAYLMAVAARTIGELGELRAAADAADQKLATMTLETEVRFGSAADRNAFAKELSDALARLIVKYHDAESQNGRRFRIILGAHPAV